MTMQYSIVSCNQEVFILSYCYAQESFYVHHSDTCITHVASPYISKHIKHKMHDKVIR